MPYKIETTRQFLRDVKLAHKRNLNISKLDDIVKLLIQNLPLPPQNRDHALVSNYKGCRECHISPDWLLIYKRDDGVKLISLVRTGTHSDLF